MVFWRVTWFTFVAGSCSRFWVGRAGIKMFRRLLVFLFFAVVSQSVFATNYLSCNTSVSATAWGATYTCVNQADALSLCTAAGVGGQVYSSAQVNCYQAGYYGGSYSFYVNYSPPDPCANEPKHTEIFPITAVCTAIGGPYCAPMTKYYSCGTLYKLNPTDCVGNAAGTACTAQYGPSGATYTPINPPLNYNPPCPAGQIDIGVIGIPNCVADPNLSALQSGVAATNNLAAAVSGVAVTDASQLAATNAMNTTLNAMHQAQQDAAAAAASAAAAPADFNKWKDFLGDPPTGSAIPKPPSRDFTWNAQNKEFLNYAGCPSDIVFNIHVPFYNHDHAISFGPLCDVANYMRPIFLLIGLATSLMIFVGGMMI